MKKGKSNDRLVAFLYILMRDHLPSGTVEGIMEKHVEFSDFKGPFEFTNGYLAAHAEDIAKRLRQP